MSALPLVRVFHDGRSVDFVAADAHGASRFGGPLELRVEGVAHGPRPLHQVASLARHQLPASVPAGFPARLPLIYGLRFNGCALSYRFGTAELELFEIHPRRSDEDWPYPGFPELLPFVPLAAGTPRPASWDEFAAGTPLAERPPAELVAVVPPPATVGVSLWGSEGDLEGVTLVFEADLRACRVRAYNVCA